MDVFLIALRIIEVFSTFIMAASLFAIAVHEIGDKRRPR